MFERTELPPAHSFYEREIGRLTRPSRSWARGDCPFHQSKSHTSFSVNLDSGGFFCHGCGVKGGDVVAFVRLRNRCSFKMACQTLGIWRGSITPAERVEITRRQQEREGQLRREAKQKEAERQERLQLRDELHTSVRLYQKFDGELHQIGPQAEDQWSVLPPLLDDWRMTESDYCRAAGLDNPYE